MIHHKVREVVEAGWAGSVLPSLSRLVEIPALSPAYDASWDRNGHLWAAVEHVRDWVDSRGLPGARCDVVQLEGRAPVLLVDVPATAGSTAGGTVLLYGHLDKQPPQGDWSDGLGPWSPVIRDGRLYGRGTADDGYSGYAAMTALEAVREATSDDEVELILNNTWRPTLSVIGAAGLPDPADAGAVLRTSTSLRLSLRIPPTVDAETACAALVRVLTTDVPYGAQVEVGDFLLGNGWHAPEPAPWLAAALDEVGDRVFGRACESLGIGGGIPFMELLSRRYPDAQFVVTGALGADSNAHVPDEWLHLAHARKVTEAVAHLVNAHGSQ
jgi:acetylornithine deacetylase/succinyl-diaminopimelate desuccinylase-like protein